MNLPDELIGTIWDSPNIEVIDAFSSVNDNILLILVNEEDYYLLCLDTLESVPYRYSVEDFQRMMFRMTMLRMTANILSED